MNQLQENTILQGGKYRIERVLGKGGFSNTYSGYNTIFDERVAIKEFFMQGVNGRDDVTGSISVSLVENVQQFEEQREKFKKEAIRIRKLSSPHIIKVHDLFEEKGTVYYVMDFVDGESLAERLKRTGKPLPVQEVEKILLQILEALKTVHEASIWHLDLKPANIMIDKSGNVTLIDFGASKQLNVQKGGATTSTAISYTNGYAPREQMEQNYDKFGPWTDFYSLGATLYTLLSNKRPSLPTDIDDDVTEDKRVALPLPSEVTNTTIHKIILWMMSTNRNLRPQRVEDILARLEDKISFTGNPLDEETLIATPKDESRKNEHDQVPTEESSSQPPKENTKTPNDRHKWLKIIIKLVGILGVAWVIVSAVIKSNLSMKDEPQDLPADSIIDLSNAVELVIENSLGTYKYIGPVDENQLPDGLGEAIFTDGRKYKGYFIKGVLSGQDSYFRYPNGDVFEGTFKDNSFYEGKYTIAEDGSYFSGTFKNGQPDKGKWYDKDNKEITD